MSKTEKQLRTVIDRCRVRPGRSVRLANYHTAWERQKKLPKEIRRRALDSILTEDLTKLAAAQELLFAADSWAVLLIFQAMDAAGKDSTIKHVMSGVNPQGCQVVSFKHPSAEDLDHTFLWRCTRALPERGRIGIFNRSYYEEVLVVKVHPELVTAERIPHAKHGKAFWQSRYDEINQFEHHLARNGTLILKFFLHVSKDEQRKRFLDRLDRPEKHWKFSIDDLKERANWDDYVKAYQDCLEATSTGWAPWYVIPADQKWVTRTLVAAIITDAIEKLDLKYPEVTTEKQKQLRKAKAALEREKR